MNTESYMRKLTGLVIVSVGVAFSALYAGELGLAGAAFVVFGMLIAYKRCKCGPKKSPCCSCGEGVCNE